jgi:hypothetical protein
MTDHTFAGCELNSGAVKTVNMVVEGEKLSTR